MPASDLASNNHFLRWESPYNHAVWVTTRHTSLDDAIAGIPTVIRMNQTHSANVHVIDYTVTPGIHVIDDTDAVITNQNATIAIKTADCLPILIGHPSGWIGGIHAGRVGTQSNITRHTLNALIQRTNSIDGYWIFLGPRICVACYEIDPISHIHFDLVQENMTQIHSCLNPGSITIVDSDYCTACRTDLFFSFRKEKTPHRIWSGIG